MKNAIFRLVLSGLTLAAMPAGWADTFTFTSSAVTSSSQVALPAGMTSVVKAVNVGSTSASVVNGITFEADSGNWPVDQQGAYVGNGYAADGATETGVTLSGASFTQTTINILGPTSGGYFIGDPVTSLTPNTDYVFQLFLSDQHVLRGAQFTYSLGGDQEIRDIQQTLGSENLYQVSFNSGAATTFNWRLDPVTDHHDAKVSAFALFSGTAPVPEPSAWAAGIAGTLLLVVARRRR